MPKPQFPRFAVRYRGLKLGRIHSYTRFYVRKNAKFIPTGWMVEFKKWDADEIVARFYTDEELQS